MIKFNFLTVKNLFASAENVFPTRNGNSLPEGGFFYGKNLPIVRKKIFYGDRNIFPGGEKPFPENKKTFRAFGNISPGSEKHFPDKKNLFTAGMLIGAGRLYPFYNRQIRTNTDKYGQIQTTKKYYEFPKVKNGSHDFVANP